MNESTLSRTLVAGVGNPGRGDDAAGWEAIRRLRVRALPPGVELVEQSGEAASLMEAWRGRERVFLIDAASSGTAPGTVHRMDAIASEIPSDFLHCSTHSFGLAESVELARVLGELPPALVIYAIEGENFAIGAPLSPTVDAAIDRAVEKLLDEISPRRDCPNDPTEGTPHA
jgi:hydrogenase maturation protease